MGLRFESLFLACTAIGGYSYWKAGVQKFQK